MLEINLLPESYRRAHRSTPFKLLALALLVGLVAFLAFVVSMNLMRRIPEAQREVNGLKRQKASLEEQVKETDELAKKYAGYRARIDAVCALYQKRVIWAKLLLDVKSLVARNQGPAGCKLWLTKINAREEGDFYLEGFSAGPQQNLAQGGYIGLFKDFDTYTPLEMPEKREMEMLDARLAEIVKANPDPAARSASVNKEIADIERSKKEIADVRSGRIAIQPFQKFILPGTFREGTQTWQSLGIGSTSGMAWKFSTTFKLTPPGGIEEK